MEFTQKYDVNDHLPQLPNEIIHQIVSYLPGNQQWQCCILSKTFLLSLSTNLYVNVPYIQERKKPFLKFFNDLFERIYNHERPPIKKLHLCMSSDILDCASVSSINRWLEILIEDKAPLEELRLCIVGQRPCYYKLSFRIFHLKNLTSLVLHGSKISVSCDHDNHRLIGYSFLKSLSLYDVRIDNWIIQKLISNCPKLEIVILHNLDSPDLEKIVVRDHDKIKRLRIRYCEKLNVIDVNNVLNLESFQIVSKYSSPQVNIIGAPKLEVANLVIEAKNFHLCSNYYSEKFENIIVQHQLSEWTFHAQFLELKDCIVSNNRSTSLILHNGAGSGEIKLNIAPGGTIMTSGHVFLDCPAIEVPHKGDVYGICELIHVCLRSCRPKTMSIIACPSTQSDNNFGKDLKEFVNSIVRDLMAQKDRCRHRDCGMECWRHRLKNIRLTYNEERLPISLQRLKELVYEKCSDKILIDRFYISFYW